MFDLEQKIEPAQVPLSVLILIGKPQKLTACAADAEKNGVIALSEQVIQMEIAAEFFTIAIMAAQRLHNIRFTGQLCPREAV